MTSSVKLSIPVFECLFNGSESITSFTREYSEALYESLPNLYVICVAKNSRNSKKVVGGIFIKTSLHHSHDEKDFSEAVHAAIQTSQNLKKFDGPEYSALPARLGVMGSEPLSEGEMLNIFSQQFLKYHTASGTA